MQSDGYRVAESKKGEGKILSYRVRQGVWPIFAALLMGACSADGTGLSVTRGLKKAPEAVVALAAPNQNLDAVRLDPEDGCYWYLYDGPVETTLLPLRSKSGRRICVSSSANDAEKA